MWTFVAAMNSTTDILILFLPMVMMWNVRMQTRRKIGVVGVLMVGGL
jgi:hypothetical protein